MVRGAGKSEAGKERRAIMASLFSEITFGQGQEFLARLGRAGVTGEMVKEALGDDQRLSLVVAAFVQALQPLKVWRTLAIGGKTRDQLLQEGGLGQDGTADSLLRHERFTTLPESTTVDLVLLSVGELDLIGIMDSRKIFAKARALGLELCPPEVGPYLRLALADLGTEGPITIAMEPLLYGGSLQFFQLTGPWLETTGSGPLFTHASRMVFVLPRK